MNQIVIFIKISFIIPESSALKLNAVNTTTANQNRFPRDNEIEQEQITVAPPATAQHTPTYDADGHIASEKSHLVQSLEETIVALRCKIKALKKEKDVEFEHLVRQKQQMAASRKINVIYNQIIFPEDENGEARWNTFEEVQTAFDGFDINVLRTKFKEYGNFTFHQWFDDGLNILKLYYEKITPSNAIDVRNIPKLYAGYGRLTKEPMQHKQFYYGQTKQTMPTRHGGHVTSWLMGKEKSFFDGMQANNGKMSYRYMCFKGSGNEATDSANILCVERCVLEFYKAMGKSDLLYNTQKGNKQESIVKAAELLTEKSSQIKVGLAMFAMSVAATKVICGVQLQINPMQNDKLEFYLDF